MTETTLIQNLTINPETLGKPSGFAHGVLAGNTVYLGGQTALDKDMKIVPGNIVDQFRQAFSNVLATLVEAGGLPEDLVSVTIYLTDVDDYLANGREIGRLWREMAGSKYPALAGIGVSRLWQKEALIEIQGVAVIQDRA
ncbi:RidA family protein [Paeniglutamicibacter gangotriensis]|uniref:Translation initiation inhibitor n=1 Tax=Paeniglutamicibacter gangotriensis Lz1y TaxID=1276920 RepID=M7MQ86_9MICC|nr:translation initiation inhibitor [Paeniglutamicibacter gangotriensis Lz1y]